MPAVNSAMARQTGRRYALTTLAAQYMISLLSHTQTVSTPVALNDKTSRALDPQDLRKIVKKHLPAWFKACAANAETIVMHEECFGASAGELFLLGCALKYAAQSGKTVHVTCGDEKPAPRWKLKTISVEAIYREERT